MSRSNYGQMLKDPIWQKKRLEILSRDNWQCQVCQDTQTTLNVHHKEYAESGQPWDATEEQLITLCEVCHAFESEYRPFHERQLLRSIKKHLFAEDIEQLSIAFIFAKFQQPAWNTVRLISRFFCDIEFQKAVFDLNSEMPNHD